MTILQLTTLVVTIIAVAAFIAYHMQRGTKAMSEFKADFDNNAEVQELADLAKELYNKDLRPAPVKKAPKKKKPEFPVDQPTKKDKVTEQVEAMKKVVEAHDTLVEEINKISPEVVEKAVEIAKVIPEATTVSVEAVVEAIKPKKKRKYYPRKKQ